MIPFQQQTQKFLTILLDWLDIAELTASSGMEKEAHAAGQTTIVYDVR